MKLGLEGVGCVVFLYAVWASGCYYGFKKGWVRRGEMESSAEPGDEYLKVLRERHRREGRS